MKNTTLQLVSAAQVLATNTPQAVGTPGPEMVAFVLETMDGITRGCSGISDVDYEYKDFSTQQDGSMMGHHLSASLNGRGNYICAVNGSLPMAIVNFATQVMESQQRPLKCTKIHTSGGEDITEAFLSENEGSDLGADLRTEFASAS